MSMWSASRYKYEYFALADRNYQSFQPIYEPITKYDVNRKENPLARDLSSTVALTAGCVGPDVRSFYS